jgi:hypothetical protein
VADSRQQSHESLLPPIRDRERFDSLKSFGLLVAHNKKVAATNLLIFERESPAVAANSTLYNHLSIICIYSYAHNTSDRSTHGLWDCFTCVDVGTVSHMDDSGPLKAKVYLFS